MREVELLSKIRIFEQTFALPAVVNLFQVDSRGFHCKLYRTDFKIYPRSFIRNRETGLGGLWGRCTCKRSRSININPDNSDNSDIPGKTDNFIVKFCGTLLQILLFVGVPDFAFLSLVRAFFGVRVKFFHFFCNVPPKYHQNKPILLKFAP